MSDRPVHITLESTGEIIAAPPPARIWRGRTDEGAEVIAFISIGADPTGNPDVNARIRRALETRITSKARITIPLKGEEQRRED